MATTKHTTSAEFGHFHFSVASEKDILEIIAMMKRNPIHMEMDYIVDRRDYFSRIPKILPGSKVLIARNKETGQLVGCLSLLKPEGIVAGENLTYQYINGLVRDKMEHSGLLMKKLLNYTLDNHFDTDFIFGLINAENKRARRFSTSDVLHYSGAVTARFNYYELVPLAIQSIPNQYTFKHPKNQAELQEVLDYINQYYKDHLLYRKLDLPILTKMFAELPDFSLQDIVTMYEADVLRGAMILYNPSRFVSVILAKMDKKSKILLGIIRFIHRFTGLLFSPPLEGEPIKTLQIRYLAGAGIIQDMLLRYANNFAYRQKFHSISLLLDERDTLHPRNAVVYKYKSLMYAAYKPSFEPKAGLFAERPVFFDITYS